VDYEDPALVPLLERLCDGAYSGRDLVRLQVLARETWHYIDDCVSALLGQPLRSANHLVALTDACRHATYPITLATVNHDLVLEHALDCVGIEYCDGFRAEYGDLRIWSDDFTNAGIRLLKLHGSVNWYARRLTGDAWREQITIASVADVEHVKGPNGEDLGNTMDGRPELLTGTFTKILSYDRRIYPAQHFRFAEALRAADRVIIVGYGFRDKAINSRLIGWLDRSDRNRMLVVDSDAERLRETGRGAIRRNWNGWQAAKRLRILGRPVERVQWDELRGMMEP
jgi:hypothetical protein